MDDKTKINYPEKILIKIVEGFEERGKNLSESDKDFYITLFNLGITVKSEIPVLNKFIDSIKNDVFKDDL